MCARAGRSGSRPLRAAAGGVTGTADLLTAVLAAEHGMTVLHYDSDFDIAAEVLDFEQRWVLSRGSVQRTPISVHQLVSEGRHATYAHGWGRSGRAVGDHVSRARQICG